jgi:hypothetical protein
MPSFRATRYVRPLRDPVPLAPSLGFFLDNPREPEEIEVLEAFYRETLKLPGAKRSESLAWWDKGINEYLRAGDLTVASDPTVDAMGRLARMAVVARFDDENTSAEIRTLRDEFDPSVGPGFILLEDDHPLVRNDKALGAFCALLSLLVHTEGEKYFGESFVYDDLWLDHPREAVNAVVLADVTLQLYRTHRPDITSAHPKDAWNYYPFVVDSLLSTGRRLETAYTRGDSELLRFAGDLLVSARKTQDAKLRLLALVSILELLLTRNPDNQKFNVEDSISRQFVLKVGVIAALEHQAPPDFDELRKRLSTIYRRRSAIAHGDFGHAPRGAPTESMRSDEHFVQEVYGLIRAVVNRFIDDPAFVRFLKKG